LATPTLSTTTDIPNLIPSVSAPSRRGGRRSGAGATPGHLNALKHGRSSRFHDSLPVAPLDPAAVAVRVLRQKQRAVERIAASVLRGILDARHRRDLPVKLAHGHTSVWCRAVAYRTLGLDYRPH
jgi:hypothetical protein